jgi:hypothetical protein
LPPLITFSDNYSREFSTGYVLPEIEELMKDEEVVVRSAAIESLVELVSFLEESMRLLL